MSLPEYTLVCGVDAKHLEQLRIVWPTWRLHKPSLLSHPMIIFRDAAQVSHADVAAVCDHPKLQVYAWPLGNVNYEGGDGKWQDSQRYRMLAGFVHVPAEFVRTPYWLKLDTDTVATGQDDWIDPTWFESNPAIVAHSWSFTKPPDQMVRLDHWVYDCAEKFSGYAMGPPLNMVPTPGASRLSHPRIISWCGFFSTEFTRLCAGAANKTCGMYKLPVASQDGLFWYLATRMNRGVVRTNMKSLGWEHWHTFRNITRASREALACTSSL